MDEYPDHKKVREQYDRLVGERSEAFWRLLHARAVLTRTALAKRIELEREIARIDSDIAALAEQINP